MSQQQKPSLTRAVFCWLVSHTGWFLYSSLDQFKDPYLCMMSVTGWTSSKTVYSKKNAPPRILSILVLGPCTMVKLIYQHSDRCLQRRGVDKIHLSQSAQVRHLPYLHLKQTSGRNPLPFCVTCANPSHVEVNILSANTILSTAINNRGCNAIVHIPDLQICLQQKRSRGESHELLVDSKGSTPPKVTVSALHNAL